MIQPSTSRSQRRVVPSEEERDRQRLKQLEEEVEMKTATVALLDANFRTLQRVRVGLQAQGAGNEKELDAYNKERTAEEILSYERGMLLNLSNQVQELKGAIQRRSTQTGSPALGDPTMGRNNKAVSISSSAARKLERIKKEKLASLENDYEEKADEITAKMESLNIQPDSADKDLQLKRLELDKNNLERWKEREKKKIDRAAEIEREELEDNEQDLGSDEERLFEDARSNHSEAPRYMFQNPVLEHNTGAGEYGMDKEAMLLTILQRTTASSSDKFLPEFSGDPAQWGNFKAVFERQQDRMQYDNGEVMFRLQKSLKGKAKECVEHLYPNVDNVQKIMEVLESTFGRPKYILDYLVQKAKASKSPDIRNPSSVVDFGRAVEALVTNAESYGKTAYLTNVQLVSELEEKLPPVMKDSWFTYCIQKDGAEEDLREFSRWLNTKVKIAQLHIKPTIAVSSSKSEEKRPALKRSTGAIDAAEGDKELAKVCKACGKEGHKLEVCKMLKKMKLAERRRIVKDARVCFCCLKERHSVKDCSTLKECGVNGCKRNHNAVLHSDSKPVARTVPEDDTNGEDDDAVGRPAEANSQISSMTVVSLSESIIKGTDGPLPIVPVTVMTDKGARATYALLDSGATRTLISRELAEKMKLDGTPIKYRYKTVNGTIVDEVGAKRVNLKIHGRYRKAPTYQLTDVITLRDIGLSPNSLNVEAAKLRWPHLIKFRGPSLIDAKVELVIGGDHGYLMMHRTLLYNKVDEPVAMRTVLGWVMQGKLGNPNKTGSSCFIGGYNEDRILDKLVMEAIKLNDDGGDTEKVTLSQQDKAALAVMEKTVQQRPDGRWEIGLLWKDGSVPPDGTYEAAVRRLIMTEKRAKKDVSFGETYNVKIKEYLDKKYLRKLTEAEAAEDVGEIYISHFGVKNIHKPGKFRLVFDCAEKVNGVSFNDRLLTGPDFTKPLPEIIMNFRIHNVVLCGDIEDMYHRVYIKEEDRRAQRMVWRDCDSSKPPDIYEMQVMLFGSTCSPSCAIFVKDRNAERFESEYSTAVAAIKEEMYIDDLCTGMETEEGAIVIRRQINEIMQAGGFVIKKWMSNSPAVMESIPEELRLPSMKEMLISKGSSDRSFGDPERVLGMYWDPGSDQITFKLNFAKVKPSVLEGKRPTKREVCSLVMSIFDPIGFVANYKVKGHIILQKVWLSGVDWDEKVKEEDFEAWRTWLDQLPEITKVMIPRQYFPSSPECNIQLHTFVDASAEAMCAVSYFRIEMNGNVNVAFVAAKIHVAPTKKTTIPRLELCAAVNGSKLADKILRSVKIKVDQCYFWSDSSTVLSWIRSDSSRFLEYVANRISKIHSLTKQEDWRWISTGENVADEGTRLQPEAVLSTDSRWLNGTEFLKLPQNAWPMECQSSSDNGVMLATSVEAVKVEEEPFADLRVNVVPCITHFSKLYCLVRATALVKAAAKCWLARTREENNIRFPWTKKDDGVKYTEKYLTCLTTEQIADAERTLLKKMQVDGAVYKQFAKSGKFDTFYDQDGIVRVKGRLSNITGVSEETKTPILLPRDHPLVDLIVDEQHRKNRHGGRNTVFNILREKYWLPGGRHTIRKCWSICQICKLKRIKPSVPTMGDLPVCRVDAFHPPFTYTGTDLFGPVEVTVGRHHEKRWGILFTCMVTRGLHLEVITGLSADMTLLGLSRFVCSRGVPKHIYSDNGTNYQAVAKLVLQLQQYKETDWHFIPPASPHMGGAWESMVKQVKKVLKNILHEQHPNDQVLLTALKEVEFIVNSRPLAYISNDLDDPTSLTPNHFLRGVGVASGDAGHQIAEKGGDFMDNPDNDIGNWGKQWEKAQKIAREFWLRWSKEVLPDLLERRKRQGPQEPIQVGELVVIVDEQAPRNQWRKAIVSKIYPGSDGIARHVDIIVREYRKKTVKTYKRPVVKLCRTGLRGGDVTTTQPEVLTSRGRKC